TAATATKRSLLSMSFCPPLFIFALESILCARGPQKSFLGSWAVWLWCGRDGFGLAEKVARRNKLGSRYALRAAAARNHNTKKESVSWASFLPPFSLSFRPFSSCSSSSFPSSWWSPARSEERRVG